MKILLSLFLTFHFCFSTQSFAQRPGLLQPLQMQADFDLLKKALYEAHGGWFRYTTPDSLQQLMEGYRRQLDRPLDKPAFISILSAMLAAPRDGHMRLEADDSTRATMAASKLFPLRLLVETQKLTVMYNDTPKDSTILPGATIISINNKPVGEILDFIMERIPGDGYIRTGKKGKLERNFPQYYWMFINQSSEFDITVKNANGKIITTHLTGVTNTERTVNRNQNPVNASIQAILARFDESSTNISMRMPVPGVAAIRIRSFDGASFAAELDSVFQFMHTSHARAMILDLRGNGGGVDMYGALLVSYFTSKPFRYFDRIHLRTIAPSFATWKTSTFEDLKTTTIRDPAGGYLVTKAGHPGVAEQPPASRPFLGKLVVLTDGSTFSTAADVCAILRQMNRALFVGEETGGAAEGNISGLNAALKLPYSRLNIKIHLYDYWNSIINLHRGRGTLPDYPIEKKMADLMNNNDEQWNKAIAVASN